MTAITKFEDLIAWQEARKLVSMIYKVTSDGLFSKDFGLKDQIQRTAVEVQSLFYAALGANYIKDDTFKTHYDQARKTQAIIDGLKKGILKNPRRPNKPVTIS